VRGFYSFWYSVSLDAVKSRHVYFFIVFSKYGELKSRG
jgi:hypothetical protein